MGKVYLKTKYDNEMKMEIPHNHNFASAMFGFREMAAEIVPYHLIDDIYDDFKREDIALDYMRLYPRPLWKCRWLLISTIKQYSLK